MLLLILASRETKVTAETGVAQTGDTEVGKKVFHSTHLIVSTRLRDHKGQALLFNGQCPGKLPVLSSILIQAFQDPVPESSSGSCLMLGPDRLPQCLPTAPVVACDKLSPKGLGLMLGLNIVVYIPFHCHQLH